MTFGNKLSEKFTEFSSEYDLQGKLENLLEVSCPLEVKAMGDEAIATYYSGLKADFVHHEEDDTFSLYLELNDEPFGRVTKDGIEKHAEN